ncbi:MAG: DNA cytosine methyltransferase [Candidatus Methanomethyliaceae archaeon]
MSRTAIDLFCGAGGLSLGFQTAGFKILCAVDNWDKAIQTYALNFQHPAWRADISALSTADIKNYLRVEDISVDVVIGGPPCQGFSIQRIGEDHDKRNPLVLEFGRIVTELRPKLFLMENVPGILGRRGMNVVRRFEEQMTVGGYCMRVADVNAAAYGVPQMRRRIFFYGWESGRVPFHFPAPVRSTEEFRTVWDAIGDLPSPPADNSPHPDDPLHRCTRLSPMNQQRIRLIPPGGGMEDLPVELRVPCHKNGANLIGHRYVYGRLALDKPASTITARFDSFTRGRFGHPVEHRNITLREGARLQSFPDSFIFLGSQEEIAAMIGNAVPPLLAHQIAVAMLKHLEGETHDDGEQYRRVHNRKVWQLSFSTK